MTEQGNDISRITAAVNDTLAARNGRRTVATLGDEIAVLGTAITELAGALVEVNRESFARVLDLLDGMADRIAETQAVSDDLDKRLRKLEKGAREKYAREKNAKAKGSRNEPKGKSRKKT